MTVPARTAYTLYWEAMSGAMVVELALEHAGIPYVRAPVDMAKGEHRNAEYLSLNPTGQVPALRLPSGQVVGESAAILLTLGERHPEAGLAPEAGTHERPVFLRWLIYMAASPYMTFVQFNHPERFIDDPLTHAALVENARTRLLSQFTLLDRAIVGSPYFLADEPCALDFYLYMLVEFFDDQSAAYAGRPSLSRLHGAVAALDCARAVRPRHTARLAR
jgi:glutathione S-transferase